MVHATKPQRKLGFGMLSPRSMERLNMAVEFGYLVGSVLFTVGTVYFFPMEDDDLALGSETVAPDADGDAMRAARDQVAARLEEVLGPESGRELAAALWDREGGLLRGEGEDDEDILGAFWRSFLPQASVDEATDAGAPSLRGAAQEQGGAGPPASRLGAETPSTCRDTLPFIESQLDCQGCEP